MLREMANYKISFVMIVFMPSVSARNKKISQDGDIILN